MKYRIHNAQESVVVEGDDMSDIIRKFVEQNPKRATLTYIWSEIK